VVQVVITQVEVLMVALVADYLVLVEADGVLVVVETNLAEEAAVLNGVHLVREEMEITAVGGTAVVAAAAAGMVAAVAGTAAAVVAAQATPTQR
jgi:hypothetical protein